MAEARRERGSGGVAAVGGLQLGWGSSSGWRSWRSVWVGRRTGSSPRGEGKALDEDGLTAQRHGEEGSEICQRRGPEQLLRHGEDHGRVERRECGDDANKATSQRHGGSRDSDRLKDHILERTEAPPPGRLAAGYLHTMGGANVSSSTSTECAAEVGGRAWRPG